MTADERVAVGIDIGGTRVRAGAVTAAGELRGRVEGKLPADGDPALLRELVAGHLRELTEAVGDHFASACVALPGVWDQHTGVMQKAVNLPRLEGQNLPALFGEALGRSVRLEADANAVAWGQWHHMTPRPARLVFMSLGTGVGGAVILDGELVRHTRGTAGHFGFLIVDTTPGAPGGRNRVPGCLSALVAGPALHLAATGHPDEAAIGEEDLPDEVIERAARALAVGFMQLVHVYAPDAIALGGGVIDHHPELVERARAAFSQYHSPLIPPGLRIERAPLSTKEAGVIGAGLLALHAS